MTKSEESSKSIFKSKKLNVFLLFILLALLFSVLTKLSQDYTQSITFNITPINVPEDKIIIDDSLQKMNITLSTYGFKLIRYHLSEPSVTIDINALDKIEDHFLWTERKGFSNVVAQFDPNVKIENINPDTLKLRFDTNAVKKVPVILRSNIEFSPGYDLVGTYSVQPDSIKIIGPNVLIDTIQSVSTNMMNLNNVNANIASSITLEAIDNDQINFSTKLIEVTAEVNRYTEGTINVPVIVKNIPAGVALKIYPKNIEVVYYANLSELKNIESKSFIVECDYQEAIDENTTFLTPKITLKPEKVKSARLNIKRIEFFIIK